MKVPVTQLRPNPGQMRTTLDSALFAGLVQQMYERGFDEDKPLLVTPDTNGLFRLVRGHRRWLSLMFTQRVREAFADEAELEQIVVMVGDASRRESSEIAYLCAECGEPTHAFDEQDVPEDMKPSPDTRYCEECENWVGYTEVPLVKEDYSLYLGLYPQFAIGMDALEVPVIVQEFESPLDEQLALVGDNFGDDTPDLLGQVRAFRIAAERGANDKRIALACGVSVAYVKARLALSTVDQDFADYIIGHALSPKLALFALRLPEGTKREAFIRSMMERTYNVGAAKERFERLRDFEPPQVELALGTPAEVNRARMQKQVWDKAIEADQDRVYELVSFYDDPLDQLAREVGYTVTSYGSTLDEGKLLADMSMLSCATCQIREHLRAAPKLEFSPGYPCQKGSGATSCRLAVAPGDALVIYVGTHQADEKALKEGASMYYNDAELFKAAMAAWEKAQPEPDPDAAAPGPAEDATAADEGRAKIRSYMYGHDKNDWIVEHPLAARCADCKHKRSDSPVKDTSAPHCDWAKGRRKMQFYVWQNTDNPDLKIPWCQQYAPRLGWADILPEHPGELPYQRTWFVELIEQIGRTYRINTYTGSMGMLETLTGRPMRSTENHRDWFLQQLEQCRDALSDKQVLFLFLLVTAYWSQLNNRTILLPMLGGLTSKWTLESWPLEPMFFEPK
ncbi:MAG: ParB N-terminal domain-containing protein [Gammaproteobacteria bacterium]|nr:ParB N-terminal domain-containing protein [Gammaproteobacteria bacterium]